MEAISKESDRTVLFVSHNMEAIKKFCTKTLLLEKGKITKIGNTNEVINYYLNKFTEHNTTASEITYKKDYSKKFQILKLSIIDCKRKSTTSIDRKESFILSFDYFVSKSVKDLQANVSITTYGPENGVQHNTSVFQWSEQHYNKFKDNKEEVFKDKGIYKVEIDIPGYLLNSGRYMFTVGLAYAGTMYELINDGIIFTLYDTDSSHALKTGRSAGLLGMPLNWKEKKIN